MRDFVRVRVISREDLVILEYRLASFFMPPGRRQGRECVEKVRAAARWLVEAGIPADFSFKIENCRLVLIVEGRGGFPPYGFLRILCNGGWEPEVDTGGEKWVIKTGFDCFDRVAGQWTWGVASRPHYRETVGGDLVVCRPSGAGLLVAVVDVLGHGRAAYRVAAQLEEYLQVADEDVRGLYLELSRLSAAGGRGCALFLAHLVQDTMFYLGVGNIRAWLVEKNGHIRGIPLKAGVVGRFQPDIRESREPVPVQVTLVVCTDGIKRGFTPLGLAWVGLLEPEMAARRILGEYGMKEDDASVLVVRRGEP